MRRLAISFAVLLVLLIAGDRVAAALAGHAVASTIASDENLTTTPSVSIHGFPFLTQAFAGDYTDVTVSADAVHRGGVTITHFVADLHGVHVPLSSALHRTVKSVPVDSTDATITLGYDDLNSFLSPHHLTVRYATGATLAVTGTVTVAGRSVQASGTGRAILEPGGVKLVVDQVQAAGVSSAALAGLLDVTIPLTGLPFGVQLRSVTVASAGVSVSAHAGRLILGHG